MCREVCEVLLIMCLWWVYGLLMSRSFGRWRLCAYVSVGSAILGDQNRPQTLAKRDQTSLLEALKMGKL